MTDIDLSKYEGHKYLGSCTNGCRQPDPCDAAVLLAEVRRLREENEQQRKTIERYAQWDAQRQRNVDLAAQLTALRQSHARLLKEMYFQRERWVLLKQVPDDPGDQAACAIRNLDAAVAEAEAL